MRTLKESDAYGNGLPIIRSYDEHSKFTVFVCDLIAIDPMISWEQLARRWNEKIKGTLEPVPGDTVV